MTHHVGRDGTTLTPSTEERDGMALRLADRWIWDSWYVWEGEWCHAFYLCASKGLSHPEERHRAPSIGHARSRDLMTWEVLPDALAPRHTPGFDSWSTWTGSTVHADDGTWWLFYTGSSREDGGLIQRIGAATSSDLVTWQRVGAAPLVEADPHWYELLDTSVWHDQAWRDPWVFRKPGSSRWSMLVTARAAEGEPRERAVVGYAESPDLRTWEVMPPLSQPGEGFGQYEVLQFVEVDGVPLLVFCCGYKELGPARQASSPDIDTTYSVVCSSGLDGIDMSTAVAFPGDAVYAGRVVQGPDGGWNLLGFIGYVDGTFVGEISDPIPVTADPVRGLIPR